MPRVRPDVDTDDLIARYLAGESSNQLAAAYAMTKGGIKVRLHKAGIVMRGPRRHDIDAKTAEIVRLYGTGVSELALARQFGIARAGIRRRLLEYSIRPRGGSESMYLRMANNSPEQRKALAAAAHAALRGQRISRQHANKVALAKQASLSKEGNGERMLLDWLIELGIEPIAQKAVGHYNVDIAIPPIAVEVHINSGNPANMPYPKRRIKYLTNAGWYVLYVWITLGHPLCRAAAEDALAFYQFAQRHPSSPGQYRVIRGSGEFVTGCRLDRDHVS